MLDRQRNKFLGAGLFAALAASLCCIVPLLAVFAGISGTAASFSWMEPFRPYLLIFTVIALAFAWYQNLKSASKMLNCDCEKEKPKFFQTTKFLGIVTAVAVLFMAFPYYSAVFYKTVENNAVMREDNLVSVEFEIEGMTCASCEHHVVAAINLLPGIKEAAASYKSGKAYTTYDMSLISKDELAASIEKETGYKILKSNVVIN